MWQVGFMGFVNHETPGRPQNSFRALVMRCNLDCQAFEPWWGRNGVEALERAPVGGGGNSRLVQGCEWET